MTIVRFTKKQRTLLGETVGKLANYGAAALVFGQLVGQGTVSWPLVLAAMALWLAFISFALVLEGEVTLLDWLGRRKDRQSRNRPA